MDEDIRIYIPRTSLSGSAAAPEHPSDERETKEKDHVDYNDARTRSGIEKK